MKEFKIITLLFLLVLFINCTEMNEQKAINKIPTKKNNYSDSNFLLSLLHKNLPSEKKIRISDFSNDTNQISKNIADIWYCHFELDSKGKESLAFFKSNIVAHYYFKNSSPCLFSIIEFSEKKAAQTFLETYIMNSFEICQTKKEIKNSIGFFDKYIVIFFDFYCKNRSYIINNLCDTATMNLVWHKKLSKANKEVEELLKLAE